MSGPVFYEWPNGMKSIAGGTRDEIKLSRPWQQEIVVNPETCSFCTGKGHVLEELKGGEWLLLQNRFTPYSFHRMVIPRGCWMPDELRTLGGEEGIGTALRIIWDEARKNYGKKLFVTVHIGALAGQNVGHLHWHIVEYMPNATTPTVVPKKIRHFLSGHHELILFGNAWLTAGVVGARAGQCFVLPKHPVTDIGTLAYFIHEIVMLYGVKLRSTQGLPPDFSVALQFFGGEFQYGVYTPILNHWGGAEQMALYELGCPITLPWSHELTAKYLKS